MAIDVRNLLPPPQLFSNKEQLHMNHNKNTTVEPTIDGFWNTNQTGYDVVSHFPVTDATWPHLLNSADNTPLPADLFTNCYADGANVDSSRSDSYHHHQNPRSLSSVLGQDICISCHIDPQQQTNHYLSPSIQKVRSEIIMEALEERLLKSLRAKEKEEEERERLGKVNNVLEERVKLLANEIKFWRNHGQTNRNVPGARLDNLSKNEYDEQSYCGSNSGGKETVRMCRKCGKEELCMLLLPCGHLCLCGGCGFTMHTCPTCQSYKEGSIHVNF